MILLDTSGVLAWIDGSQRLHASVKRAMERQRPPFLLSPFVLAELDYLLGRRVGQAAQHALLEEVVRGAYRLERFEPSEIQAALSLMQRYTDLQVGLADASIAVLASRYRADTVLTLDERHFRTLPTSERRPFRILPADFQD